MLDGLLRKEIGVGEPKIPKAATSYVRKENKEKADENVTEIFLRIFTTPVYWQRNIMKVVPTTKDPK